MIFIGSDHAGFKSKEDLKRYFESEKISFKDCGCFDENSCDYPLIAKDLSLEVSKDTRNRGILICGSGIGMSIAANKIKGIRAALCSDLNTASLSRKHNDANIICLGARALSFEEIKNMVNMFLNTSFEGERHQRRVNQIKELENL